MIDLVCNVVTQLLKEFTLLTHFQKIDATNKVYDDTIAM